MNKILSAFLISLFLFSPLKLWASDETPADEELTKESKSKLVALPPARNASNSGLVDLDTRRIMDKLNDLQRRIQDLERNVQYQRDEIQNLERTVNDLRRGRF